MRPATLDITIHQRATYRQLFNMPISLTGHTVVAQIWDEKRRNKIIEFDVEWVNQAAGEFYLVADFLSTEKMTKDSQWDLMIVYANGEREYWIEGTALFDPGYTDPDD
jgi:hypothetical protein